MSKKKKFDCVEFKNKMQEQLYNRLNPSSVDDYLTKLKKYTKSSKFRKMFPTNLQNV